MADPFTRKRLTDLAGRYDALAGNPSRASRMIERPLPLPRAVPRTGRRGMKKPALVEVRCDACNGTGFPPVQQPESGRRIYPTPCKKCGGKGRVTKNE